MNNGYSTCLGEANTNPIRYSAVVCMVKYNYPIIILNVDISSLFNKVLYHFDTATFSCQVQGSHLMERKKVGQLSSDLYTRNLVCKLNHKLATSGISFIQFPCHIALHYLAFTVIWQYSTRAIAHAAGAVHGFGCWRL